MTPSSLPPFSVLMSIYAKERPEHLELSLGSLLNQTVLPDEIVLVLDGPLTPELDRTVTRWAEQHPDRLNLIALSQNVGLGPALRIGLDHCRHELIARMDTDDISLPQRFERQLAFLQAHPSIDVVGSWIGEFATDPQLVQTIRHTPETSEEIRAFARSRNPISHPSVMLRRSAVSAAGGYLPFLYFEDYHLWARMLLRGSKMANLPEVLLLFRTGYGFLDRRRGWSYAKLDLALQQELRRIGFISWPRYLLNLVMRLGVRLLPKRLLQLFYQKVLRKKPQELTRQIPVAQGEIAPNARQPDVV